MDYNSDKFKKIITSLNEGRNVLLHGPGGTGKSYLLKEIAFHYQKLGLKVGCTATTGVSALNVNEPEREIFGCTLHRWAGIGLGEGEADKLIAIIQNNKKAVTRWTTTNILIIDEVSMMGQTLFEKLDYLGRIFRNTPNKPFGGILLVMSGDFLQLPPVKDEFVFKSKAWKKLELKPFIFDIPIRYEDSNFFHLLLRVRKGQQTKKDEELLYRRIAVYKKFCEIIKDMKDEEVIKPTEAYSHKIKVEMINTYELKKLPGEEVEFERIDKIIKLKDKGYTKKYYEEQLKNAAPEKVILKVGAQVMLTYNLDVENGLVNGSRGVVTEIHKESGIVKVKFLKAGEVVITRQEWEFSDKYGKGVRSQIPLILAWAHTIHKLQGCTLDYCIMNLGNSIFASGQAYVALSRVRCIKGLFLSSFSPSAIITDQEALEYVKDIEKDL